MQPVADPPAWFTDALARPPADHTVDVAGCAMHYCTWGAPANPALVCIHGGAAHAHWWDHLAPHLADDYFVIAPDLSGHGDSARRDEYPREIWVEEVMAIIADANVAGPPVLVGHSMGGMVTLIAAATCADRLKAAVIVDAGVPTPKQEWKRRQRQRLRKLRGKKPKPFRITSTYPTLEAGIKRFRLMPRQGCGSPYLIEHIGRHALMEVEADDGSTGYQWKCDDRIFQPFSKKPMHEYLAAAGVPLAFIRGEKSVVCPRATTEYMLGVMGDGAQYIEIPGAHHHLILDHPLEFLDALRTVLAEWEND